MILSFLIEWLRKKRKIKMLVLTRRMGESIIIGDNIRITVLETGAQVRIGITAPKEITVHRDEIYEKIQQERPPTSVE